MNILHFAYCFIHIWIVSTLGLQWIMLLWTLSAYMFSFLLGVCLGIGLLSLMLTLYLTFWETAALLPKVVAPFYIPNIHVWGLGFSAPGLPKGRNRSLVSTLVPRAWPGTTQGLSAAKAPGSLLPQAFHCLPLYCCFLGAQLGVSSCLGKCQKSSPDARRQPFSGKSFYLDLPAGKNLQFLTGAIQQLGGVGNLLLSPVVPCAFVD